MWQPSSTVTSSITTLFINCAYVVCARLWVPQKTCTPTVYTTYLDVVPDAAPCPNHRPLGAALLPQHAPTTHHTARRHRGLVTHAHRAVQLGNAAKHHLSHPWSGHLTAHLSICLEGVCVVGWLLRGVGRCIRIVSRTCTLATGRQKRSSGTTWAATTQPCTPATPSCAPRPRGGAWLRSANCSAVQLGASDDVDGGHHRMVCSTSLSSDDKRAYKPRCT